LKSNLNLQFLRQKCDFVKNLKTPKFWTFRDFMLFRKI